MFNFSAAQNLMTLEMTRPFASKSGRVPDVFLKSLYFDVQKCVIPQKFLRKIVIRGQFSQSS
jgi:hypothetical protein